ncbi:bifunctional nuclease family protein [Marinoscillum pacificum]|uniref:bifunctional nuclease family protein n=1 Tax=Marinoscillum pacificum TaxID=392723 RepID=UPI0021589727|nr:bifunctional nuclease domain-containing protein [Marinoscillum pacificum]
MADKIKLEILGLSSSQSQSGSFALVLGEVGSNRRLPIIIGMFEAQAIAIEIEKITPNRPMTHDLFKSFAFNLGYDIKEIYISDLKEGVFFAKIICESNGKSFEIDARPSDAIAIGLRFNVDIYTNEPILTEAGIVLSDEEEEITDVKQKSSESSRPEPVAKKMEDLPSDQLNKMLDDALAQEDYERAAKIRDEINKRN